MKRRLFLGGVAAFIAAPALVARANIMAVRSLRSPTIDTQLLWRFHAEFGPDRWLIMHPDRVKLLRDALDPADASYQGGIVQIGGFLLTPNILASNYGRGPGQIIERPNGRREWKPWH